MRCIFQCFLLYRLSNNVSNAYHWSYSLFYTKNRRIFTKQRLTKCPKRHRLSLNDWKIEYPFHSSLDQKLKNRIDFVLAHLVVQPCPLMSDECFSSNEFAVRLIIFYFTTTCRAPRVGLVKVQEDQRFRSFLTSQISNTTTKKDYYRVRSVNLARAAGLRLALGGASHSSHRTSE